MKLDIATQRAPAKNLTPHLSLLESEAIHILRETAANFRNPVLLFSGGKDSITLVQLALKAFHPATVPFALVHIDTGHNFAETIAFRDALAARYHLKLIIGAVSASLRAGSASETRGILMPSRNAAQAVTLLETIHAQNIDACIGGGRRDEEKARAKERIFSHRNAFGAWTPQAQRAELWDLYNTNIKPGEHMRCFPLSNWTEYNVWEYIAATAIELPSLYFTHRRKVLHYKNQYLPVPELFRLPAELKDFPVSEERVRFRTLGDMSCSTAFPSAAATAQEVLVELSTLTSGERGSRLDDQVSPTAMEERKKQGYF